MKGRRPTRSYYTPPSQPALPPTAQHKRLEDMNRGEAVAHTEQLLAWLRKKQDRERNYLAYRASKGRHTSTDEVLEEGLIAVLEEVLAGLKEGPAAP